MVSRRCPVCGANDRYTVFADAVLDAEVLDRFAFSSRKTPEYMHYRLLECGQCDVLYANPIPTREALESAYRDAAFDSAEEARYASVVYAGLLPPILKRIPSRQGALDIGTGDGAFLEQLLAYGFHDVVGVETSAATVKMAAPSVRTRIRQAPFRAEDFTAGSMSLVTCFQTMEHVYDPLALCRETLGLLREGGALLLVCHNRRALSARILGQRSPIYDIEHLQLFSPKSLRYALESAGFRDVETHIIFNRYPLHYWLRLSPIPAKLKARLVVGLKNSRLGRLPIQLAAGNFAAIGYRDSSKKPGSP
jgi:SAM-dependent methyltransferase